MREQLTQQCLSAPSAPGTSSGPSAAAPLCVYQLPFPRSTILQHFEVYLLRYTSTYSLVGG